MNHRQLVFKSCLLETALMAVPEYVVPVLTYVGTPAGILAVAGGVVRVSRAAILHKAANTALSNGDADQRREAGLKIVKELTRRASLGGATFC